MKISSPTRKIPTAYDVRRLVCEGFGKSQKTQRPFETLEQAKTERDRRVRQLRKLGLDLADTLANCKKGSRCRCLACSVCSRIRRIRHTAQLLSFLSAYPAEELSFVTLVNPADAVRRNHLATFDPKRFVTKLRRQLQRAGFKAKTSFIIALIDGEWDEGRERYQPHVHAVIHRLERDVLQRLIRRWPRHRRVRSPSRVKSIDDLPRVVTYLDKSWWPSVARRNNRLGVYPHGKRRPPKLIEIEILTWMAGIEASHLALLMGVKRYGGVLMKK